MTQCERENRIVHTRMNSLAHLIIMQLKIAFVIIPKTTSKTLQKHSFCNALNHSKQPQQPCYTNAPLLLYFFLGAFVFECVVVWQHRLRWCAQPTLRLLVVQTKAWLHTTKRLVVLDRIGSGVRWFRAASLCQTPHAPNATSWTPTNNNSVCTVATMQRTGHQAHNQHYHVVLRQCSRFVRQQIGHTTELLRNSRRALCQQKNSLFRQGETGASDGTTIVFGMLSSRMIISE